MYRIKVHVVHILWTKEHCWYEHNVRCLRYSNVNSTLRERCKRTFTSAFATIDCLGFLSNRCATSESVPSIWKVGGHQRFFKTLRFLWPFLASTIHFNLVMVRESFASSVLTWSIPAWRSDGISYTIPKRANNSALSRYPRSSSFTISFKFNFEYSSFIVIIFQEIRMLDINYITLRSNYKHELYEYEFWRAWKLLLLWMKLYIPAM